MTQDLHPSVNAISQRSGNLQIKTPGPGFSDISDHIAQWLETVRADTGVLTVFIKHTSASLVIQENADPDVQHDLRAALEKMAPENARYRHTIEGPDDMPAHIKSMITNSSLTIPMQNGRLTLGTWQGIYVIEHRSRAHSRELSLNFMGSFALR